MSQEKLFYDDEFEAMRFCGRYDPLMFACDETWHARPDRKAPEDEQVRLVESISTASDTLQKAMKQLDRLQTMNTIKAVA